MFRPVGDIDDQLSNYGYASERDTRPLVITTEGAMHCAAESITWSHAAGAGRDTNTVIQYRSCGLTIPGNISKSSVSRRLAIYRKSEARTLVRKGKRGQTAPADLKGTESKFCGGKLAKRAMTDPARNYNSNKVMSVRHDDERRGCVKYLISAEGSRVSARDNGRRLTLLSLSCEACSQLLRDIPLL